MKTTFLKTFTKDGIALEGIVITPKRRTKTALVWVYGLGSRLSGGSPRHNALVRACGESNIAYAVFENRGAGAISFFRNKKGKYVPGGKAMEPFERCVFDLEAMIRCLRRMGFKEIFFAGHSTGANKLAYFIKKRGCRGVRGFALVGPMSDIPSMREDLGRKYKKALELSGRLVRRGRGGELLPLTLTDGNFWTAARFWSIAREGANEDTFPYYRPGRKFAWAKKVTKPILVLVGANDQFADRPIGDIMEVFKREIPEKYFSGKVVSRANHGFSGRERELASAIVSWTKAVR